MDHFFTADPYESNEENCCFLTTLNSIIFAFTQLFNAFLAINKRHVKKFNHFEMSLLLLLRQAIDTSFFFYVICLYYYS